MACYAAFLRGMLPELTNSTDHQACRDSTRCECNNKSENNKMSFLERVPTEQSDAPTEQSDVQPLLLSLSLSFVPS